MPTHKKYAYIAMFIVGFVALCFLLGGAFYALTAEAETTDPKAAQLIQWIDEQSSNHRDADGRAIQAAKDFDRAVTDRDNAAEIAKGHRKALCIEFGLLYTGSGQTVRATDGCSDFQ